MAPLPPPPVPPVDGELDDEDVDLSEPFPWRRYIWPMLGMVVVGAVTQTLVCRPASAPPAPPVAVVAPPPATVVTQPPARPAPPVPVPAQGDRPPPGPAARERAVVEVPAVHERPAVVAPAPVAARTPAAPVAARTPPPAAAAARPIAPPAPASCSAHVESVPAGATVKLGRQTLGTTPLDHALPCGASTLTFEHKRYATARVEVNAGATPAAVSARLERPAATLELTSVPAGASIRLNGRVVGQAPLSVPVSRFETLRIEAAAPGQPAWRKSVYVRTAVTRLSIKLGR
jgi:hypothetical protein